MKILIVYYSRTGTTKKVAEILSKRIRSDIEEIVDNRSRKGFLGYFIAGYDAVTRRKTRIKMIQKHILLYDLVIIGTPIWAWNLPPAVRTFLLENKDKLRKVAFFATGETSGDNKIFKDMQSICEKEPIATLFVKRGEKESEEIDNKIIKFITKIKSS